ncbi:MAG: hypothetical protein JRI71_11070 [Deltaproteobacteria bacterium]|nr:hypothetical protein [Deltaproteobacteria bacterium]
MARSMNPKQNGSDTFHEAIKRSHAALEYVGLVSWSIISRSSTAVIDEVQKFTETVGRNVSEPFFALKYGIGKAFGRKVHVDERIKGIEETIKGLEERLAFLEKHGVRISERDYQEKKRELDKERKEILSRIVEENKRLRELLKT